MTEKRNSHSGTRLLVIEAALVIIIRGINQAEPVLASFLVAVFLSVIGTPPVLWLERKRIPSAVAVLIVVAGMIAILALKFACENNKSTRWIAVFLGREPTTEDIPPVPKKEVQE